MYPRGDDIDDWQELGTIHTGSAHFVGHELDEDDFKAFKAELKEALARKRAPGFTAAWPEDTPTRARRSR